MPFLPGPLGFQACNAIDEATPELTCLLLLMSKPVRMETKRSLGILVSDAGETRAENLEGVSQPPSPNPHVIPSLPSLVTIILQFGCMENPL